VSIIENVVPLRRPDTTETPNASVPDGRWFELSDGNDAFVRISGGSDGMPTLLLHGLGATAALNWSECYDPLAQLGPVIAPDHRGHGRGARVGHRFSLRQCADDAAEVLRQVGGGPAVVVGYSMGGPIAQLLARRHPELVAGLVLCATARDFRGAPADRLRFAALAGIAPAARLVPPIGRLPLPIFPGLAGRAWWALDEVRRHDPSAIVAAARSLGRFTSRAWVHELDAPATVLVHTEDTVVPTRRQHKLAASLADAGVIEVAGDHLAVANDPERFVPALLQAHSSVRRRFELRSSAA
jgi:3-oxoadipate enol-lactonase